MAIIVGFILILVIVFLAGAAKGGKSEGGRQVLNFINLTFALIALIIILAIISD